MPKLSAGLLVHRRTDDGNIEVLLVHPGGPYWAKKDEHAWSIPKGEYEPDDDPFETARREFTEELGQPAPDVLHRPVGLAAVGRRLALGEHDRVVLEVLVGRERRDRPPGQPEGGRVLIVETLVERNDGTSVGAMVDLQMMMVCSEGRERSRSDFDRLLRDAGFTPGRILAHPAISVIEGLPA